MHESKGDKQEGVDVGLGILQSKERNRRLERGFEGGILVSWQSRDTCHPAPLRLRRIEATDMLNRSDGYADSSEDQMKKAVRESWAREGLVGRREERRAAVSAPDELQKATNRPTETLICNLLTNETSSIEAFDKKRCNRSAL